MLTVDCHPPRHADSGTVVCSEPAKQAPQQTLQEPLAAAQQKAVDRQSADRNGAAPPELAQKIKADDVAAVFRNEIRADVEALKARGVEPTLVAFLSTGDASAKKYSEWTMKACEADGIKFEVREVVFHVFPEPLHTSNG